MSQRIRRAALAALLICVPSPVWAQTPQASPGLRWGGSVRTLAGLVRGRSAGPEAPGRSGVFDQTLLRITVDGHPTERLTFEAHFVQSYTFSSSNTGSSELSAASLGAFGFGIGDSRYRALDATTDWLQRSSQVASLWLDRLNVRVALPRADVTIGRQAITFGKAYFWNPLDEFLPFDARQIDRDYKAGVDAVRVDIPTSPFSGVNVVVAPGRELNASGRYRSGDAGLTASWYGSAALGRYFATVRGWDAAVQAGKVYGGTQLGGGLVGEIKDLEVRAEVTYLWAAPSVELPAPLSGRLIEDHFAAVAGIGRRFQNTLWIQLEHFHNGAGNPEDLDAAFVRFATGAALNLGREITGVTASYEFTPVLTGQLAALQSWSDGSTLFEPTVTYSVGNNSDLIAGAVLGLGDSPRGSDTFSTHLRSEFGSFPRAVFAEMKLYF
jgi:hypothetical protein